MSENIENLRLPKLPWIATTGDIYARLWFDIVRNLLIISVLYAVGTASQSYILKIIAAISALALIVIAVSPPIRSLHNNSDRIREILMAKPTWVYVIVIAVTLIIGGIILVSASYLVDRVADLIRILATYK